MENRIGKLFVKIVGAEKIIVEAAGYLREELKKRLGCGKKILLLLSGGSAVEVYRILAEWFKKENKGFAKNLTVSLIDERYSQVGHADSNEKQIRDTGFYAAVEDKGGTVISVLTDGGDPSQEASRYDKLICRNMKETDEVWAVLGVGPDGHTAGILPQKSKEEFDKNFPSKRWVAYYRLLKDYPNPFKKRITLTPKALKKITLAVVVAKGEEKKEALQKMFFPTEPVYKTPAVLLRNLHGVLFTDYTHYT